MFFAKYILKDRILKISKMRNHIRPNQEDIEKDLSRLYTNIYDIRLALEECIVGYEKNREYRFIKRIVEEAQMQLRTVKNGEELNKIISDIVTEFDDFDYVRYSKYSDTVDSYHLLTSCPSIYNHMLEPFTDLSEKVNRGLTAFQNKCQDGSSFAFLKQHNYLCYGIDDFYLSLSREHAEKVVKGNIKGSRIKNDAFDAILFRCNIGDTLADNMRLNSVLKQEKDLLMTMYRYLRPDGVALIVIPYFRMYKDISEHIAKSYKNVKVFRNNIDDGDHNLYIYAQKTKNRELNEETYKQLRACFDFNSVEKLDSNYKLDFNLPQQRIEIDLFKGSVLDMDELYDIVECSGIMDEFFEGQVVEKLGDSSTKPLLPFNIGQLGLVLTSGCLDGIIDEGNGCYHLVKGRVSKKSETVGEVSDGVLEESETISNRVEINIISPNGEFKTLT